MPDLQNRFHLDMLVLSEPLQAALARGGYDLEMGGIEMLAIMEEEAVAQALRTQMVAGPQCLCTPTWGVTRAQLAHARMRDKQREVVQAALALCAPLRPQHLIAEIGATGLPLDPTSKTSLTTNRDQYAEAAQAFGEGAVDAFLMNGLAGYDDARCAIMGVRKVSTTPIIASVDVDEAGKVSGRDQDIEDVVAVMADVQADVVGIRTDAAPAQAAQIVKRMAGASELPILVQLVTKEPEPRQWQATTENPYWHPDTMMEAAALLRAAGAQFLRAVGAATTSYTGALCAATAGLPTVR